MPHVDVDAGSNFNAFGWSTDILKTDAGSSFVFIGEPGRNLPGTGNNNDGQVYIYKYNS